MTLDEFLNLETAKEMWDIIVHDPEFRHCKEAEQAFNQKAAEEYKQRMIERYGFYDPDFHIDPLRKKH